MGHTSISTGIEHLKMILQSIGHIVGIENRYLCRLFKTDTTHHANIHPTNGQNTGAAIGRGRYLGPSTATPLMLFRKKGLKMRSYTDRTNPRTTATVRYTKGFMKIQVRHITPKLTRLTDADHGIEIGPINIYLTTMVMDNLANLCDALFEYAMGGWVGNHNRGKVFTMRGHFILQV